MIRSTSVVLAAIVAAAVASPSRSLLVAQAAAGPGAAAGAAVPDPKATTPAACLDEVRAYVAARQSEAPAAAASDAAAVRARNAALQQIAAGRTAMDRACAAKFDPKTIDASQLLPLIQLDADANQIDLAVVAVNRALALTSMAPADRASLLVTAISVVRRLTAPNADRPWRVANVYPKVEALVDELDANAAATFAEKWSVHTTMESVYRGDDIDAGILKHGAWILAAARAFSPEERQRYGPAVVSAHVNMAEAYAGQNMTDKALALLTAARTDWKDLPGIDARVDPTRHRYELVGTPAAPILAAHWLNAPAGTTSLALPGKVTLLEFTAHWCGPCRESYPGINRLRERFAGGDFRVVMVTRLWGYFGSERNLPADAEIAHDRDYFAEHGLDVPVAIGEARPASVVNGAVAYTNGQDPNDTAYRVNGIPQIQVIDANGTIRLIMVGYDNANEAKLGAFIQTLLDRK